MWDLILVIQAVVSTLRSQLITLVFCHCGLWYEVLNLQLEQIVLLVDHKDQMSVANRAALEKKIEAEEEEADKHKLRPTEIAKSHGNKPSRGAVIDEEIENEEREELKRKGKI